MARLITEQGHVVGSPCPGLAPAHTDWLYHHLQISGPASQVSAFRKAAAGAGVIPWRLDLDRMEEDFFLRLAAPPPGHARTLSMDGARLLEAELRGAVARRHALAVARVGHSAACPFDLHALLPVPVPIRVNVIHSDSAKPSCTAPTTFRPSTEERPRRPAYRRIRLLKGAICDGTVIAHRSRENFSD